MILASICGTQIADLEVPRASDGAEGSEFEGLVLLKRYALAAEQCRECDDVRLGTLPRDMPTARPRPGSLLEALDDPVEWVLRTNGSAIVFDFEGPSLGIGNCLFGFLQAFHWAVVGGLPLFILSHPTGTANALCSVFDCGFPVVTSKFVAKHGHHRFIPSPKEREYRTLRSHSNKPFKVVCFRSHMGTQPCLKDAFSMPNNAACAATSFKRKSLLNAAVCWHVAALQALIPRLSRGALLRLPGLMKSHLHGDVSRILSLAEAADFRPQSEHLVPAVMSGIAMPALHVRTLNPKVETYAEIKGNSAASVFQKNLELLVAKSDFCTFLHVNDTNSDSAIGGKSIDLAQSNRDVFVASDSLALKELLASRWEPSGWRLHFFTTAGARLTTVPRPEHGFSPIFEGSEAILAPHDSAPRGVNRNAKWWSRIGGDAAQFCTLIELWLLSRAAPLVAMTFFDVRLATAAGTKSLQQEALHRNGHGTAVKSAESVEAAVTSELHELRALSTFAKSAAIRGGLGAAAGLSQCHGTASGRAPLRVGHPGPGACSSECHGLKIVYSP